MRRISPFKFAFSCLAAALIGLAPGNSQAQTNLPVDVGTMVNGFQDNFTAATRDPGWTPVGGGGDKYYQTNGVLHVGTMTAGNPNHLLYMPASGYAADFQEVLVRIRITAMPLVHQGSSHAGIVVGADATGEALPPGSGVNWMLMNTFGSELSGDDITGTQARALYDYVAWGNGYTNEEIWEPYTWYWMRLQQDGLSSDGGTITNIVAKIWLADGTEAEPADWQYNWSQDIQVTNGVAGITAGTSSAEDEFEVDYFLLKAAGLPSITVSPVFDPLYLNQQPVSVIEPPGQSVTFSVTAVATSGTPTYQWQSAPPGSAVFTSISGATSSSYTTGPLGNADNNTSYRVVVSLASPAVQVISTNAVVTIGLPPTVVYAKTLGQPNQITLLFSEPVAVPGDTSGFSINNGATITGVSQGVNTSQLVLTTTGLTLGGSFTVTINGVQSTVGVPIAAGTQVAVSFVIEVPLEYGTTVNGFQDDFDAATRDPAWTPVPADNDPFVQTNGVLHMITTSVLNEDPVHLFYESASGYSSDNQEVLMRIRITQPPASDAFIYGRGGPSVAGDPANGNGHAANIVMIDPSDPTVLGTAGPQVQILADGIAWGGVIDEAGTTNALVWEPNTWYWLRLLMTTATPTGANYNIFAKAWLGDGSTPEPAAWQSSMAVNLNNLGDTLYAGIVSPSAGFPETFDVDYFLLETPDLPPISVALDAFSPSSSLYLAINVQPESQFVLPGTNATFTADAIGSAPVSLQWLVAPNNSSTFAPIPGATNNSLTITNVLGPQNGNQYEAVFTLSVGGIVKTSQVAVLTTDVTPPALVFARTAGVSNQVIVQFSKAITIPQGLTNFSIDQGVTISAITAGTTSNEVVLSTSPLSLSTHYTLSVFSISDLFGNVLTNAQVAIDFKVYLPSDFGSTVSGFQDAFNEGSLDTNWVIYSAISGGALNNPPPADLATLVTYSPGFISFGVTPSGDAYNPLHLVYAPPTPYNSTNQEVLARIRVTSILQSGSALSGVCVSAQANNARSINWLLEDPGSLGQEPGFTGVGPNVDFLDDYTAYGPSSAYIWSLNTWYWMRLRQAPDLTAGAPDVFGKIWLADGATPEPTNWLGSWDYTPANLERGSTFQGYAGLTAADSGGFLTFDVSYVLIKADGLPSTTVSDPSLFPFAETQSTMSVSRTAGGVSVQWTGTGTLQTAPAVSGPWSDVTGATNPYAVSATGTAAFFRIKQ